jgi:hypothetical protein
MASTLPPSARRFYPNRSSNLEVAKFLIGWTGLRAREFSRLSQRFKDITLTVLIESTSEAETESQFSALSLALKDCVVSFSGMSKAYSSHFKGKADPNGSTLARGWGNRPLVSQDHSSPK